MTTPDLSTPRAGRALIKQGLVVDKGGALTDLGLAVRAILKGE